MKALIPILVFTFFTVLVSCDTDDIVPQENSINSSDLISTTTVQTETIENNNTRSFNGTSVATTPEAVALQHSLQWISYTTTSAIFNDIAAKNQFLNRINYVPFTNNSDTIIDIEDLIGDNIPDADPFKAAFRAELVHIVSLFYLNGGCPLGPSEAPEPPLDSGSGGNGMPIIPNGFTQSSPDIPNESIPSPTDIEDMVDAFITYILSDECIEIYLPIGFTATFTEITSSAHPVSTATINNGYRMHLFEGCGLIYPATEGVGVNIGYTYYAEGPIIIARPTKSRRCLYANYDFDFKDFLT